MRKTFKHDSLKVFLHVENKLPMSRLIKKITETLL